MRTKDQIARIARLAIPAGRRFAVQLFVLAEGLLTLPIFLASWWLAAIYRSVLAGWAVSGLASAEKRSALSKLMGADDNAS